MPILFIHGVNNRQEDADYIKGQALRRQMFETEVVRKAKDKYPNFKQEEDTYWGDKGVSFAFGLKSIPATTLQSLGPATATTERELAEHAELIHVLKDAAPETEILVHAAKAKADGHSDDDATRNVLAAILENQYAQLDRLDTTHTGKISEGATEQAKLEGAYLALFFIAREKLLLDGAFIADLRAKKTDDEFLSAVKQRLFSEMKSLTSQNDVATEQLGPADDFIRWAQRTAESVKESAKDVVEKIKDNTIDKALRGSSLVLLKEHRQSFSRKALLFFGDVFEYLHRGREEADSIASTVAESVATAHLHAVKNNEPLVVVTHSFGSMILYDLLTAGKLPGVKIDLWITAGAQVSLFAEMRLYKTSPTRTDKTYGQSPLGTPQSVGKWVNFYDHADILSYLMNPVFGSGVEDVDFKHGANIKIAHGDYFVQPEFYRSILNEILKLPIPAPSVSTGTPS